MSERPSKRARLELQAFLDIEAGVDETDDDQEDDTDQNLEEDEDTPDNGSHRRLRLAIQAGNHSTTWDWDAFLSRAKERTHHQEPIAEGPRQNRILWEVSCRIGHEETLVFTLMQHAMSSLTLAQSVRSIVGKASKPGRVFVEADERCGVEMLLKGVANISGREIKPVLVDRLESVLEEPLIPRISSQTWVRICHGGRLGRRHDGDIGLVLTEERDFEIAVIPKVNGVRTLLSKEKLPVNTTATRQEQDARYQWKGRTYTDSGFLVARFEKDQLRLDRHYGMYPTKDELHMFHKLKELAPRTLQLCLSVIGQQNLRVADKVKIVSGELCNLVGDIRELDNSEAIVYISSQDYSYPVPLHQLRVHYQVGDQVRVVRGQDEGSTGWVVNICVRSLDVLLHSTMEEVNVDVLNIEHHTPESTPIRPVKSQTSNLPSPSRKHIHQGKDVIVVKKHTYKGYYGIIKDVLNNDTARVELAANMKTVDFPLRNLALMSHHRHILKVIQGETRLDRQGIDISNEHASDSTVPRASTPPPIPGPSSETNSAWVPDTSDTRTPDSVSRDLLVEALVHVENVTHLGGSQVPRPSRMTRPGLIVAWEDTRQIPGVHWLMHPALQGLRLKLYDIEDDEKTVLEYKGFEARGVVVRKRLESRVVMPVCRIRAVYPSQASQLVTPLDGEDAGEIFRVLTFDAWRCILRNIDKSIAKKSRDKTMVTVLLVEIFPELRNK